MNIFENNLLTQPANEQILWRYIKKERVAIKSVGFGNRFFEPEELRIETDKILHVTLKNNVALKARVLDFLIEHNITTCMSLRDGLIKISFGGMIAQKTEINKYVFTGREK